MIDVIIGVNAEYQGILANRRRGVELLNRNSGAASNEEATGRIDNARQGRVRSCCQFVVQFSTRNPGTSAKCFSLLVISVSPSASACAAINRSKLVRRISIWRIISP